MKALLALALSIALAPAYAITISSGHTASSTMHIGATVLVSCIDPSSTLEPEIRSQLNLAVCGDHSGFGTPVVIQKTSSGVSIVDAKPGLEANATIRVGERPGVITAPMFDPVTQTLNY